MRVAIWWIRRDLRLADNPALTAALAMADQVIPLFILDPHLAQAPTTGAKRLAFLLDGLRSLDADLARRGSRLIFRQGDPQAVLADLVTAAGAGAIVAQADVSPYARRRDAAVAEHLPLQLTPGVTVFPSDVVTKADGSPYTVFTPFSRAWKALPPNLTPLPAPGRIPTPVDLASDRIPASPALPPDVPFEASEAEAQRRLRAFADGLQAPIRRYHELRDRPDLDGTSQLSPYLRFGLISPRQAAAAAYAILDGATDAAGRRGAEIWLNELIWREFNASILYHFPGVLRAAFRPELRSIPWDNNPELFAAWCEGRTGYPIVDAAMLQLVQTGWMHNRARMIVASFLVKDLLIDWRWGERFFMQHLVDGDPASNNGGWQWTAGVGTDAAPYFRIFNPVLQGEKFDPNGDFVRRWLPALAHVPAPFIHKPWTMTPLEQRQAGCVLGQDYPAPIVDHAAARERTLAAYQRAG
ncbi:MAG: deoxyribodipyrimidine photo-lyase [Anaerolineae bacterium]